MSDSCPPLAFGDVVLLNAVNHPKGPLLLSSDGLATPEISCAEAGDEGQLEIRNCLFRLVPRLNYSAASELREKNRARMLQADGESVPSLGMHWEDGNDLKKKAEKEASENSKVMECASTILKYGDRLQLYHVKSDKFVTCIPEESAHCNKKARRAALTDGNEGSTFVLLPMYKYQDTGDPVQDGDSMMFYPVELGSAWFLRPAEMCNPDGNCECQIFSRAAGWKTRRVWRSSESTSLHYGSVIRLLHPQQEVYLKASTSTAKWKDGDGPFVPKYVSATPSLRKQGTKHTTGKTFWVLESVEPLDTPAGPGLIAWGSRVALRHLLSGHYLTAIEIPLGDDYDDGLGQPSLVRPDTSESCGQPALGRMRPMSREMTADSREGMAPLSRGNKIRRQPNLARSSHSHLLGSRGVGTADRSMLSGLAYEQFMNLVLEPTFDPERCCFVLEYPGAEHARSSRQHPLPSGDRVRVMLRYDARSVAGDGSQAFYVHCSGQKFNREKEHSQSVVMNLTSWRSEADTLILLQNQENVRDAETGVSLTNALNEMSHRYARMDRAQKDKAGRGLSVLPPLEGTTDVDCEGQSSSIVGVEQDGQAAGHHTTEVDAMLPEMFDGPTPGSDDIGHEEDELFFRESQHLMVQKNFQHVLWTANNFLTKTDIGQDEGLLDLTDGENLDKLLCDDLERAPDAGHQTMFREARGMDAIVNAVGELRCTLPPRQTSRAAVDLQDLFQADVHSGAVPAASSGCLKLLFVVFRAAYQDSRENEDYVLNRKWIEGVIIPHFAYGVYAEKAFSTLVTNNRELLDRIDAEIVFKFTKFIRELGPDQDFLEFMESICSCQGRGITRLQELCLRVLYHAGARAQTEEIHQTGLRREQLLPHFEIEDDELFVSWHHNGELKWRVGQDYLYHAPVHLGLKPKGLDRKYQRERVFLTDLFHFNVRPNTAGRHEQIQSPQSKMKAQSERALDALACYFKRYLFLVAEMCISRSVNCVEFLQEEFTQPLLLAALKESSLPFDVRAAFARVMQMLYIDIPGKVLHVFPSSTRSLRSIQATLSKDHRSMTFHAASDSMVQQLEDVIVNHFKAMGGCMVVSEVSKNQFSKVLLDILLLLLRFGHFDVDSAERLKKLQEITKQILPALDGREDLVSPESRTLFSSPPSSILRTQSLNFKPGSRCCCCCCCGPRRKPARRSSRRVAPELRGSPSFERMDETLKHSAEDQAYHNAAEAQEDMQLLLDCKQVMIKYLRVVLDMGQEYLISRLLEVFEAMYVPNGVQNANSSMGSEWNQKHENVVGKALDTWRKAFWEDMGLMDLECGKEKCFTAVLLHLSLYSSQQLHEAVMDLLYTSHHMIHNTIEKLGTLEVITDRPTLDQYVVIRGKVENLEYLLCSHERWLWNNEFSPRDVAKVDEIMRLLTDLRLEVSATASQKAFSKGAAKEAALQFLTDLASPNQVVQNMCSSLGVINLALSVFLIEPSGGEAKTCDKEGEQILMCIQTLCSYLLAQLCRNHPGIQATLFECLDVLIEQIPKQIGIEHVVSSMFASNAELCERITRDLVIALARRLRVRGWHTSHLRALSSLLSYGHAFHHVKSIMLDIFKDDKYSKCLQIEEGMQDMVSRREALEELLRAPSLQSAPRVDFSSPTTRVVDSDEAKVAYSIELLNFLATLCKYRDPIAESFVQYLCSPATIARQFLDVEAIRGKDGIPLSACLQFQRGCLRLLVFAYIDVFHADIVYYDSEINMMLLQKLVNTLMNEAKATYAAMEEYVTEGVLEYLMKYAENAFENGRSPRMVAGLLAKAADALDELRDAGRYDKFNLRAVLQSKPQTSSDEPGLMTNESRATHFTQPQAFEGTYTSTETNTLSAKYFSRPVNYGVRCLRSAVSTVGGKQSQRSDAQVHEAWQHFVQKLPDSLCFFREYKSECEDLMCSIEGRIPGIRDERIATVPKGKLFTTWIAACMENSKKGWNWSSTCQLLLLCLEYLWSTFESVCKESGQVFEASDDLHEQLQEFFAISLPSDVAEIRQVQDELSSHGLAELVSRVLAAQPPQRTLLVASELATALAMGAPRSVQDKFGEVFAGDCGVPVLDLVIEKLSSRLLTMPRYRELRGTLSQLPEEDWPSEMVAQMTMVTRNTEFLIMAMCFLKQLCECHHVANQNYMRDPNDSAVDLLPQIVTAVGRFSKNLREIDEVELELLASCLEVLSETMQGPCPANQAFLAGTRLLESLMRICRSTLAAEREDEDGRQSEIMRTISQDSHDYMSSSYGHHGHGGSHRMAKLAVRLREAVIGTMNAMIECRLPNDAHKEVYAQMQSWVDQSALDFRLAENYRLLEKAHVNCERPEFEEAQQIMILIESMRLVKPDFCSELSPDAQKAVDMWKSALRQVEVVLPEDHAQRVTVVHFPQPPVMSYVPSTNYQRMERSVILLNDKEKAREFIEQVVYLLPHAVHATYLSQFSLFRFFLENKGRKMVLLEQMSIVISMIIALVLIVYAKEVDSTGLEEALIVQQTLPDVKSVQLPITAWADVPAFLVYVLSWVNIVALGLLLVIHICIRAPVQFMRASEQQSRRIPWKSQCLLVFGVLSFAVLVIVPCATGHLWITVVIILGFLVIRSLQEALYWIMSALTVTSSQGNLVDGLWQVCGFLWDILAVNEVYVPLVFLLLNVHAKYEVFYYSWLPMAVVFRFESMTSVVQALVVSGKTMLRLAFLACLVISIFAFHNFLENQESMAEEECTNVRTCYVYTFYRGLTHGDGIGDYLGRDDVVEYKRVLWDVLFFIVFTVIMFNLIAAVIIDNFGALRDEQMQIEDLRENYCLLSGLSRPELDLAALRAGKPSRGFDYYSGQHGPQNTRSYMAWIFHLLLKERSKMTGPELHCVALVEKRVTSWLPIGRAVIKEDAERIMRGEAQEDVQGQLNTLSQQLTQLPVLEQRVVSLASRVEMLAGGQEDLLFGLRRVSDVVDTLLRGTSAGLRADSLVDLTRPDDGDASGEAV